MASTSKILTSTDWLPYKVKIETMINGPNSNHQTILGELTSLGFTASKDQLERQLKKWGIITNLPKGQSNPGWRYIDAGVTKRKAQGKKSIVVIGGKVFTDKAVARATGRNKPINTGSIAFQRGGASPKPPEDVMISICSPNPHQHQFPWPPNLPWLVFQHHVPFSAISLVKTTLSKCTDNVVTIFTRDSTTGDRDDVIGRNDNSSSLNVSLVASRLRSFMPEAYPNESLVRAQRIIQGSGIIQLEQLIMVVLFQLSNNLHSNGLIDIWPTVLILLRNSGIMGSHLKLKEKTDATILAVTEKLYWLAFKARSLRHTRQPDNVRKGTLGLIQWLLSCGWDPNKPIPIYNSRFYGEIFGTSLQAAIFHRDSELVPLLLSKGANSNFIPKHGMCLAPPLVMAIDSGSYAQRTNIINVLLEKGASPNLSNEKTGPSPLFAAIYRQDFWTVELLIKHGVKVSQWIPDDSTELSTDSMNCHLEDEIHPEDPETPIFCFKDHKMKTDLGCAAGIEPESDAYSMVKRLLDHLKKTDPNKLAKAIPIESLLVAAGRGYTSVLTLLLNHGIPVNIANDLDFSALHLAAYWGHYDACRMLLDRGALIDPPSLDSPSPLLLAACHDHWPIVQLLCQRGANVDRQIRVRFPDYRHFRFIPNKILRDYQDRNWRHQRYPQSGEIVLLCLSATAVGAAMVHGKTRRIYEHLVSEGAEIPDWAAHHAAGQLKEFELVSFLVKDCGQDPNQREARQAPLWAASRREAGQTLLQAALHTYGQNDEGTKSSCRKIASLLLDHGATIVGGEAVQAVLLGDWVLVRRILNQGDAYVAQKHPEYTMIRAAFLSGKLDIIREVFDRNPEAYDPCALCIGTFLACHQYRNNEMASVIARLLKNRSSHEISDDRELLAVGIASWYQNMSLLISLLDSLPKSQLFRIPRGRDNDLLRLDPTIIYELIQADIKPHYVIDISPLAFTFNSPKARDLLLDHGYQANVETLKIAARLGGSTFMKELLPRNRGPFGRGLLSLAVKYGSAEIVKILLESGEDINDREEIRDTPLQAAIKRGDSSILTLILDHNPDINAKPSHGNGPSSTALQLACKKGYLSLAKRLIDLGANINAQEYYLDARTALECAAENGKIDVIQLLLSHGVDTTTGWGLYHFIRATAFAEMNGHQAAANILRCHWTADGTELPDAVSTYRKMDHIDPWSDDSDIQTIESDERVADEVIDPDGDEQMTDVINEVASDVEQPRGTDRGFSESSFNTNLSEASEPGDAMDLDEGMNSAGTDPNWIQPTNWDEVNMFSEWFRRDAHV
ncbi:ankyrin repeat-containing domain protein [Hypomontagnella monticulosa]|nr:ankyrin repeat-containing domain protein [Hypomontagnella monticulosa]